MATRIVSASLFTLAVGAVALFCASFVGAAPAAAYDGRHEGRFERGYEGFRPAPPAMHGYWGQRRWRRYHDGYGFRAPPPPRYGYGPGWR